jgi:hypothetical protein
LAPADHRILKMAGALADLARCVEINPCLWSRRCTLRDPLKWMK